MARTAWPLPATFLPLLAWLAIGLLWSPASHGSDVAGQIVWQQDFASGTAGARPYHRQSPQTAIEHVADPGAKGGGYIRGRLPGQRDLEGFHVTISDVPSDQAVRVTMRVRGRGDVMPSINARSGWMYNQSIPLTDQWQTVTLQRGLAADETSFSLHLISRHRQHDAVYELDEVVVEALPRLEARDVDVPPLRLRAADLTAHADRIVDRDDVADGQAIAHGMYMQMDALPFPSTTRSATVYVRVWPASKQDRLLLRSGRSSGSQVVASVRPASAGQWQWLRMTELRLEQVGRQYRLDYFVDRSSAQTAVIDAVVISTNDSLDDAQLDAQHPLDLSRPAITARRLTSDMMDSPWWEHSPRGNHFVHPQTLAPVEADTQFAVGYDDQALYVHFKADEPTLDVAAQRRHEFQARVTERDGPVFSDESLLLMVQPDPDGPVYEFAANALGTLADARCEFPDLWSAGRDTTWQSSATAQASIEDGYWTLLMRIPLADLGVTIPRGAEGLEVTQRWNVIVARITRSRNDTASWNPSGAGAHAPLAMGQLFFGPSSTVGLVTQAPVPLAVGEHQLTAALSRQSSAQTAPLIYLRSRVSQDGTHQTSHTLTAMTHTTADIQQPVTLVPGEVGLDYTVLDGVTLAPLYHARPIQASVTASQATLTLSTSDAWSLWHNGRRIAQGHEADQVEVAIALQAGANALALEAASGTAQIQLEAPRYEADQVRWRVGSPSDADATAAGLNDTEWALAEPDGQGSVGTPGRPAVFRHTILWNETRHWPTADPALFVARNSVQHVNLITNGLPGRPLHDFEVYFAVPPAFEVLGSTAYYGRSHEHIPSYETQHLGSQQIDGQAMQVYRLRADQPIVAGRHHIMSLVQAFVRYREQAGEPADDAVYPFIYWTQANGGSTREARQQIPVRVLPPLAGKQPQRLTWQLWGSYFNAMDNHDMADAAIWTMRQAGMNQLVALGDWTGALTSKHNVSRMITLVFRPWSIDLAPYLKQHPEHRFVDFQGNPSDSLMCMSLLIGEGWQTVEPLLAEVIGKHPDVAAAWYDFEFSPFGSPHGCFCLRCREAFASELQVDASLLPDGPTIREGYQDQWVDFMARRSSKLNGLMKQTVNATPPHPQFGIYSGYQTPENPLRYGIDWTYIGQDQSADVAGLGYGRPMPGTFETTEALGDIPAIYGAIVRPYGTSELRPLIPVTKAQLLRRALDATGGVLVYDRLPMDGRCWLAIAETTRLVAAYEDHFALPRGLEIPGVPEPYGRAVQVGDVTLVCVMNTLARPQTWTVSLDPQWGAGQAFYSEQPIAAGQTQTLTLEPGETVVYVLKR